MPPTTKPATTSEPPTMMKRSLQQLVIFSCIGVINTAIDYTVYSLLVWSGAVHYLIAACVGYTAGLINSFFLNRLFTFPLPTGMKRRNYEWPRFVVVNLASLGCNLALLWLFVDRVGLDPYRGRLVAIAGSLMVNFLGNKLWTFRYLPAEAAGAPDGPATDRSSGQQTSREVS
jgi:putative flippase GtrA